MIYLASPYSDPDPKVRQQRYQLAFEHCALEMSKGKTIFSPIVYGHRFAINGLAQTDHEWWKNFNEAALIGCATLEVLKLPGWEASRGIEHEIDFAKRLNMLIRFTDANN